MTQNRAKHSILYLWKNRTLFIGNYPESGPITQGAASLIVSIDTPITVHQELTGELVHGTSFLIPAGVTYSIVSKQPRIANCYLDSRYQDFLHLSQAMRRRVGNIYEGNKNEFMQSAAFEKMLYQKLGLNEAYHLLESISLLPFGDQPKRAVVDQRVIDTIRFIKSELTINHKNKLLATRLGMTEVSLQRLFKSGTGLSIRRYRLWHRLFVTIKSLVLGKPVAEAVAEAGFTDAPHFNHVFKDMLGTSPSSILHHKNNITFLVDNSYLTNTTPT